MTEGVSDLLHRGAQLSDEPVLRESESNENRRTPLFDLHTELGGRIVDFAGWDLPIQYEGVVAEHTWCRTSAALFDVSHMGVVELRGDDPAAALERVTPAGITTLQPGSMRYGLLLNDDGGIIDDFMVANDGDHLAMVVNASRRHVDVPYLRERLPELAIVERTDVALLALQGPEAADTLTRLVASVDGGKGVADLFFLDTATMFIDGTTIGVTRSGYTGEDGFELTIPAEDAERIARRLLDQPEVRPAGLGARDTLRLEAGLCLYGNDLDETTSPVEADLVWSMPKRRRDAGDFPGGDRIKAELAGGVGRVRVGLAPTGKRPVRDGAILSVDDEPIGLVSSGGFGPTVERPVAMGYVHPDHAAGGTQLSADVRGTAHDVVVADLPFTPSGYRRRPKEST